MAFCSNLRITQNGVVLLDYDDKIDAPPSVSGEQTVQVTPYLRAETVGIFPRGNQSHTIEWTSSELVTTADATATSVFSHAVNLPREQGDVVILLENSSTSFQLKNAVVQSWSSSWDNKRESKTISIIGGEWLESISPSSKADSTSVSSDSSTLTADTQ